MCIRYELAWTALTIRTVHQQHLNLEEKIIRHFDLSSQYGVCETRNTRSLPSPGRTFTDLA